MSIIRQTAPDFSASDLADIVIRDGIPADYTLIYKGRNRVAVSPDGRICLKAFAVPGFFKALWYGVSSSKASRAFYNALKLKDLGISTPDPFFFIERHSACGLAESYYACRMLQGWSELRSAEKRDDFPQLATALAEFVSLLHDKEVWMKDLSMGNVLFIKENDTFRFVLVDINRMSFAPRGTDAKLSDFINLLETESGTAAVVRHYAAINGLPADTVQKVIARYNAHQAALMRKRRIKEFIRGKKS